jgi:hypothetical protein
VYTDEKLMDIRCASPKDVSIGDIVLRRLNDSTTRLESLVTELNNKISSIMVYDEPCCGTECASKEELYPPYFADIRVMCNRIDSINITLNETINRTKL